MPDKVKEDNMEFAWGIKRGREKNKCQYYQSFTFDGVEYSLYDSVYVFKDDEAEPYIGKLIKIWENKDGEKKVKLLWFFHPRDVSNYLGNDKFLENELFLACGDGVGLTNVNDLEAIAGKCNVVCISRDERNRQPSERELKVADHIFYRTFDVEKLIISDKLCEKIADAEVALLLNKSDPENSVLPSADAIGVENCPNPEVNSGKGLVADSTDSGGVKATKLDDELGSLIVKGAKENHFIEACDNGIAAVTADSHGNSVPNNIPSSISLKQTEVAAADTSGKDVAKSKPEAPPSSQLDTFIGSSDAKDNGDIRTDVTKSATNGIKIGEKPTAVANKNRQFELKKDNKRFHKAVDDAGSLDVKRAKKLSPDGTLKPFNDQGSDIWQKSGSAPDIKDMKTSTSAAVLGNKNKGKLILENSTIDAIPEKSKELISKVSSEKLQKITPKPFADKGSITYGQLVEVTRKPDDKSKWFTGNSWEDKVKEATQRGKLVLLLNLDPALLSSEVEDIIWHGCRESCTAKMIQRTAISTPHYGEALGIFKTKEAAENAVEKLERGCLMLPNGRPLVGRIVTVSCPAKRPSFPGHLVIDKVKLEMFKGKNGAVSTSHGSQPGTLEHDLAMEWRLHYRRSEFWWEKLHKKQGKELRELKAKLKSNQS